MLTHLQIRDFAIIDEVELDMESGLTVLTGETGAGKSILVDAVGLVLGDRAESSIVRHGARRAEIAVTFSLDDSPAAKEWLSEQALDADDDCILRRVIGRDGRSRAFINGQRVTLQNLRALGELLVDIHGQQAHQSLTRRPVQRDILDHHGGNQALCDEVRQHHQEWQTLTTTFAALQTRGDDRAARIDLLRYQVRELEALSPEPEELDRLEREHRRLANASQLGESAQRALYLLYESDRVSALQLLNDATRELGDLLSMDADLGEAVDSLQRAEIEVREVADRLRQYVAAIEHDPADLDRVQGRIAALQDLARKHRVPASELPDRSEALRAELDELENMDLSLEELGARLEQAEQAYLGVAERLSRARESAATKLTNRVTSAMHELGMPGGSFEVTLDRPAAPRYGPDGLDRVDFLVSANPGVPPRPLANVASGGELSRIALAIQVIAADGTSIPSLVFDEVDVGIGGRIAEIVGRRLRDLSAQRQVLSVTHLPQVASQSHHHIRVSKAADGETSQTRVEALTGGDRVEELARMLGGMEITARTRAHAKEMMERATDR